MAILFQFFNFTHTVRQSDQSLPKPGVSPRLEERCLFLDKWLKGRPTWKDVFERGIFNTKNKIKSKINNPSGINLSTVVAEQHSPLSSSGEREKEQRDRVTKNHIRLDKTDRSLSQLFARLEKEWEREEVAVGGEIKERMRSSTDALERLLQRRPSWIELIERGIGKDEKKDEKKKEKCKRTLRYLLRKRYAFNYSLN